MKEGIVVIDKPNGMTSHDVVACARKRFNMRRIGHAGTLDPLATGVLVLLLGRTTKLFGQFAVFDKAYRATLILGTETTSADTQGDICRQSPYSHITCQDMQEVFKHFEGDLRQVPPMGLAVKVKGRKLYQLARKGIEIERQARQIRIDCLKLEAFNPPEVK